MPKPGDFFLGVMDFFSILLPGAAFVYVIQPVVAAGIPEQWLPATSSIGWAAFLVLAYTVGHLLHALGSRLLDEPVYEMRYLPNRQKKHWSVKQALGGDGVADMKAEAEKTLLGRVCLETAADPRGTNYYDWCLSELRARNAAGALEVDRLQADSKLFRSLVFVFIAAALVSGAQAVWVGLVDGNMSGLVGGVILSLTCLVLTRFAVWRFCTLRWTATKRVYEFYLILVSGSATPSQ